MRHRRHVEAFSSLDKKLGSEAAYFNFLLRKPRESGGKVPYQEVRSDRE